MESCGDPESPKTLYSCCTATHHPPPHFGVSLTSLVREQAAALVRLQDLRVPPPVQTQGYERCPVYINCVVGCGENGHGVIC